MAATQNVTIDKNKIIIPALFVVLATPVFFATIAIALKIAIIAFIAVSSYLLFSTLPFTRKVQAKKNDVSTQTEEQSYVYRDEGYDSADEHKERGTAISTAEQEEIEAERERSTREQERMRNKSLGGPMNVFGETIFAEIKNTEESHPTDYKETMIVPNRIVLDSYKYIDQQARCESGYTNLMRSPPERMGVLGNSPPSPSNFTNQAQCKSSYMNLMQSLPERMGVLGNSSPSPNNFTNMDLSTRVHKR